jgi:polysaccharide biosynthesis protein PslF
VDAVRPLFVSTYPPEKSELATFTKRMADAVDLAARQPVSSVAAIQKAGTLRFEFPRVVHVIDNNRPGAYRHLAEVANEGPYDAVSLQHEFGLYPGEWGRCVWDFVRTCQKPIVTTFHTLMTEPEPLPRRLIQRLAAHSHGIVVMTGNAARLLAEVYDVPGPRVRVIPHGVTVPYEVDGIHEKRLALASRQLRSTFGFMNLHARLGAMIEATPRIVADVESAFWPSVGRQYLQFFTTVVAVSEKRWERLCRMVFDTPRGNGHSGKL